MANLEQLVLVARIAKEKEQQAARLLKQASDRVMAEERQETLLQQYRLDYLQQLRGRGRGGMGSALYSQFQQFLDRLDGVILGQQQKIAEAKRAQLQRRKQWDSARQKSNAIELLIDKNKQSAFLQAEKLEQKLADEYSNQQTVRKMLAERR
jgi:flagellar export protein FliJ